MRVATAYYYSSSLIAMQKQQSDADKYQQQIATQRRFNSPSEDPVGAVKEMRYSEAIAKANTYLDNIQTASTMNKLESTTLEAINNSVQSALDIAKAVSGTSLTTQERTDYANQLRAIYSDLLGYANTQDANGNYMFAGSLGKTQPFQQTTGASNYAGDTFQQKISVGTNQQIAVSDSGSSVFSVGSASDPFAAIDQLITDLQNPALTGSALQAAGTTATTNLTSARDNVQTVSSDVATRVSQLDALQTLQTSFKEQMTNNLGDTVNADTMAAGVNLKLQQTALQALMQTFTTTAGLSLFKYL
jgi:flagellar hook-associated protein 3 FlgL